MHSDSPQGRSRHASFEQISSLSNDTVKLLRSLDRKKARNESGLFLAEGARLAEEGLAHEWTPAYVLAGAEGADRPRTADLLQRLTDAGARVLLASAKVMEAVSRKDNPQTVVTAFRQRSFSLDDLAVSGRARWIALYEVRDPGNLGTIIRTADAAGVSGVILIGSCCDPVSVEAVRASMGSLFASRIAHASPEAFDAWRRKQGARLLAASMHGDRSHDDATYSERSIVLMGNEQSGLPDDIEAACDELVRIPMRGSADSLNLAAAASVMIYAAWRAQDYAGARS
ncbi:MAG: RNA methyltransferase [Hyphomonadaceae bacterium]